MPDRMFDTHCHIFNIEYLIKEVLSMLWNILCGQYPFDPPEFEGVSGSDKKAEATASLWDFFHWLLEVCEAAFSSEKENMKFLQKAARKAGWPSVKCCNKLAIIPLMMDIFYMFAYNVNSDQILRGSKFFPGRPAAPDIEAFRAKVFSFIPSDKKTSVAAKRQRTIINEFFERTRENIDWTWGFRDHYLALKKLARRYKKQIYPFFAIDPRRPGVIDALLSGTLVDKEKGPFYGVKIYPRMGYHPACASLMDVYQYCADHAIPITTHAGKGGFPFDEVWPEEKAEFGNPDNYASVLQQYNNLIIDFAHFGLYGDKTTWEKWANKIVEYMQTYPQVYSDFACYTKEEDIAWFKEKFWNIMDSSGKYIVKERTMFGTDFDVMYFTSIGVIDQVKYFQQFKAQFTAEEIIQLSHTIPEKFLMG